MCIRDRANITGDGTDYTKIFTASEIYDAGGVFTTSTYTASAAGKAHLACIIEIGPFASGHTRTLIRIVTSNRTYTFVDENSGGNFTPPSNGGGYRRYPGSVIADMDASDTATITVYTNGGSKVIDTTYGPDNAFSGYLIKN